MYTKKVDRSAQVNKKRKKNCGKNKKTGKKKWNREKFVGEQKGEKMRERTEKLYTTIGVRINYYTTTLLLLVRE